MPDQAEQTPDGCYTRLDDREATEQLLSQRAETGDQQAAGLLAAEVTNADDARVWIDAQSP